MPSGQKSRVVVAGGGVAASETLLALRDLAHDRAALTLVAPQPDFEVKPPRTAEAIDHEASHCSDV